MAVPKAKAIKIQSTSSHATHGPESRLLEISDRERSI